MSVERGWSDRDSGLSDFTLVFPKDKPILPHPRAHEKVQQWIHAGVVNDLEQPGSSNTAATDQEKTAQLGGGLGWVNPSGENPIDLSLGNREDGSPIDTDSSVGDIGPGSFDRSLFDIEIDLLQSIDNETVNIDTLSRRNQEPHLCDVCGHLFKSGKELEHHLEGKHEGLNGMALPSETVENRFKSNCMIFRLPSKILWVLKKGSIEPVKTVQTGRRNVARTLSDICPYLCQYCGMVWSFYSSLKGHLVSKHGEKTKPRTGSSAKILHPADKSIKAGKLPLEAGKGGKNSKERYRATKRKGGKSDRYVCAYCKFRTIHQYDADLHEVTCRHKKTNGPLKCPYCKQELSTKGNMKRHIRQFH